MDEKQQHSRPSLVWPVILITAGILFLLSNLDVLKINFWELWRLWPVMLILAGLDVMFGRRSALGNVIVLIITLAVIGGVVFVLVAAPEVIGSGEQGAGEMTLAEDLDELQQANFYVDFAAGQLRISQLSDSNDLIVGILDLATNRQPEWEFDREGRQATMRLGYHNGRFQSWNGRGDEWDLALSPEVELSLNINVGAGDAEVDLTRLDISDLLVETGAGRSTIVLPSEGDFAARVTGGIGQVVIEIPEDMAARVEVDRGLGGVDVSNRYDRHDNDVYETDDWDDNENRVKLQVEVGVGQIIIREP